MGLLARLFGTPRREPDLAPLWHRTVAIAREPDWYARLGIADTPAGRFDALTMVTALVMLRMEHDIDLRVASARLTELFVSDMDGQLREGGVGDLVVGKRLGKLMGALGGRIDAYRAALAEAGDADLVAVIDRNVTLVDGADPAPLAAAIRALAGALDAASDPDLLAGRIGP